MSATAVRPNGKPYRRRFGPEVMAEWDLDSFPSNVDGYVLVLRTHDVDEATAMVWGFTGWVDAGQPELIGAPTLRWVRMAICMCGGGHSYDLVDDDVRGVPAVEFTHYWPRRFR